MKIRAFILAGCIIGLASVGAASIKTSKSTIFTNLSQQSGPVPTCPPTAPTCQPNSSR